MPLGSYFIEIPEDWWVALVNAEGVFAAGWERPATAARHRQDGLLLTFDGEAETTDGREILVQEITYTRIDREADIVVMTFAFHVDQALANTEHGGAVIDILNREIRLADCR